MTISLQLSPVQLARRLTLALLLVGSALASQAQDDTKESLTVALTSPGKPGSLEVGLVNGFIHVTGYSGKDVVIDAAARAAKASRRTPEPPTPPGGMKRLSSVSGLNLTAEEKNNHVEISTQSHAHPVDLTIKVPQNFSLQLSTVNNGDILIENVNGQLEVSNVNGAIQLTNVSGSAVANTVNGNLVATFKSVNNGAPMAFSTLNGKVDVTFPGNAKASLKMKSERGEVYSDFDVAVDKSAPKVTRTSQNGLTRLSTDDWTYGQINGGGAEVMMKTFNGNIYLRKVK
ncbi:DUF4097 family beta strand repeat-containing protein [Hymenobacter sp. 5317J-9]|uniref:DUF4097 family beta strand repeat-containing protein n=1 Tax=Hymenobacter sp. 5317J-9 TaxID=2932250 RepID=UPI001FD690BB|nr:DUF4097 family beta strand repeat-containing protein [Hymenobacter sp. 5317J-9]UOQ97333.1 DUF4097 family beta strand repeat-containing protein [Hymenobacter sp. 5317J-9]